MTKYLEVPQVQKFYDNFATKMESQEFYEEPAIAELINHSRFENATKIFEFGCGTGRFAKKLFSSYLPADAKYFGVDVSSEMINRARENLQQYESRVTLVQTGGNIETDLPTASHDRFISTFVLDLLSPEDTTRLVNEAHRLLIPGEGYLCLANLAGGVSLFSHIVMGGWKLLFKMSPKIVGGCRPVHALDYLSPEQWEITHDKILTSKGVSTQVLVAKRL